MLGNDWKNAYLLLEINEKQFVPEWDGQNIKGKSKLGKTFHHRKVNNISNFSLRNSTAVLQLQYFTRNHCLLVVYSVRTEAGLQ